MRAPRLIMAPLPPRLVRPLCPVCLAPHAPQRTIDRGERGHWHTCSSCGMLWDYDALWTWPNERYRQHRGVLPERHGYNPKEPKIVEALRGDGLDDRAARLGMARCATAARGTLLEIGFGGGQALDCAARSGEWGKIAGIELAADFVAFARSRGHDVHYLDVSGPAPPIADLVGHCDLVMASEVIEHVPDPIAFVSGAAAYLSDRGVFWFSAAAVRSPEELHRGEWHYWTEAALRQVAAACDLAIEIESKGTSLFVTARRAQRRGPAEERWLSETSTVTGVQRTDLPDDRASAADRLANWVAEHGLDAGRDLGCRGPDPVVRSTVFLWLFRTLVDTAVRIRHLQYGDDASGLAAAEALHDQRWILVDVRAGRIPRLRDGTLATLDDIRRNPDELASADRNLTGFCLSTEERLLRGLETRWIGRARNEVADRPGTAAWLHSFLAFLNRHMRYQATSAPRGVGPVRFLEGGAGWADQQVAAAVWVSQEAFGVDAVPLSLLHSDGVSRHTVAVIAERAWVVDVAHRSVYLTADGQPASIDELRRNPEVVAQAADPWRGKNGAGMEGFYRGAIDPGAAGPADASG